MLGHERQQFLDKTEGKTEQRVDGGLPQTPTRSGLPAEWLVHGSLSAIRIALATINAPIVATDAVATVMP